eukprot:Skav233911  [mRNA]  locus=scaffold435:489274:494992:+ [translate_table: standard]
MENLSELSGNESVFFLCGSALLIVNLLIFCCEAPAKCRALRKISLKRLRQAWDARDASARDPAREAFIFKEMCQKKVIWAQWLFSYLYPVFTLGIASVVYNMWAQNARWMSLASTWSLVVLNVMTMTLHLAPWLIKVPMLDLLCLALHGYMAFWLSQFTGSSFTFDTIFFLQLTFFTVAQIPAVAIARRYATVLLCQGVIFGVIIMCLSTEEVDFATSAPDTILNPRTLVFCNIFYTGAVVLVHSIANRLIRHSVESVMRECDSNQHLSAASSLLDLTCDAVCEIDRDLKLRSHSSKLATMLLRRSGASLEGRLLTDFIAPGDAERAKELLMMAQPLSAHAFHTHLVDTYSSKFRTEVFQVKYTTMDGRECHLLGLRDFTDLKSLAGANATDAIPDSHDIVCDENFSHGTSGARSAIDEHGLPATLSESSSYALPPDSFGADSVRSSQGSDLSHVTMECHDYGHVVEKRLKYLQKDSFLQIDMDSETIEAASAPFVSLLGKSLRHVFANDFALELLRRLKDVAVYVSPQLQDVPDQVATFDLMPIHVDNSTVQASGVMKVCLTKHGRLRVIIRISQAEKATQVLVEDCSEEKVLRSLVCRVRTHCDETVKRAHQMQRLSPEIWEGLMLLQLLWGTNEAIAQRLASSLRSTNEWPEPGDFGQSLSQTLSQLAGGTNRTSSSALLGRFTLAPQVRAPVPAFEFHLQSLAEEKVPPEAGTKIDVL